ncbi:MAG: TonB family protein [Bacteroidaceae bacterium]|nr:TonB family protein [Bacteroidaceae bacterium]
MGSIVLYIIEWAFALLVLLGLYKAVLSGTTLYRINRIYLLGATVLSALLPLVHLTISDQTSPVLDMTISSTEFARELSAANGLFAPEVIIDGSVESEHPQHSYSLWAVTLICAYCVYVLTLLIGWSRGIIKAHRFLRGKPRRRVSRMVWLVTHGEAFGPFSWMNYIVISDTEKGFARKASLRHEFAHIRLMHSVDLIFLLACTVLNPVCWLILQEIKIVHEFQADDEVINRHGIDDMDYQRLLIMRTVGAEAYALASSFNLNIKQRIIMMNKNKTRQRRLIWLLMLVPLLGMTSVLFARTDNKADMIDSELFDTYDAATTAKLTQDGFIIGKVVDEDGPVADARVYLINMSGMASYSCVTDVDGGFVLRVEKADCLVRIAKAGYEDFKGQIQSEEPVITLKKQKEDAVWNVNNRLDVEYSEIEPQEDDVFMIVDQAPEFPNGTMGLLQYLRANIKYPRECRENNIQGRVLVSFTIGKDGSISDAEVVKGVDPLLDAEALRVISKLPDWTPGVQNGEVVKVRYTVPINFRLATEEEKREPDWIHIEAVDKRMEGAYPEGMEYMVIRMVGNEETINQFIVGTGGVIAGTDNLESVVKDIFDGKIKDAVIRDSEANYKLLRSILDKYPDEKIWDTFLSIDELRARGWQIDPAQ